MLRYYDEEERGKKLLRLVTIEEVKPATKYYMVDPMKSNYFYETVFDPSVSWDSIMEFVNAKKIYTRDERPNKDSPSKPSLDRDKGPTQSTMF